jgi:ADP-ribosylglycohydrolase
VTAIASRLYLSHDTELDWLIALEFGRVDDGQPSDCWVRVNSRFAYLQDMPDGRIVGFAALKFSEFDPEHEAVRRIWDEPRFDAPVLGLVDASAGEIVTAARFHFDGRNSINRDLFHAATAAKGEDALVRWRQCLEAGDAMAHFALGYTAYELGRYQEAYRHLRHYTEIAPAGAWNWCWFGYAAEAVGEVAEARRAYEWAVEIEEDGGDATNADERLARMDGTWIPRTDRVRGCFLGGAVGDALGAPIEFESIDAIRSRFGPEGLRDYAPAYGVRGAITDDTQMTLFTAEGILRAYTRGVAKGICHPPSVVDHAYARWLATQGERSGRWDVDEPDGWLVSVPALHGRRAPGNTCLSALAAAEAGTVRAPMNDSKGCGGVMRAAPAGLTGEGPFGDPFTFGCEIAALTHGHPSGYLAAGVLADVVSRLVLGDELEVALEAALMRVSVEPGSEELTCAVRHAMDRADDDAELEPEEIQRLGGGWVAEEALAIAVFVAMSASSFEEGVLAAVNHSGDSDSTGAIAGNLLGAMYGADAIPAHWRDGLELRDEIESLVDDWVRCFWSDEQIDVEAPEWWDRYPGW